MSKIALNSNASGTGVFTIASPNSDTDRTLTLPDSDGDFVLSASGTISDFASTGIDDNATGLALLIDSSSNVHVDGDVIAYSTTISDERLKNHVETLDGALDKVSSLRGVTYTWNAGSREGKRDLGVIAQEVEAVIPEIVHEKEMALIDGEIYKTVDYEKLTALLIEAVKELKAEVDSLKAAQ